MKRIILATAVFCFSLIAISATWYFSKFTTRKNPPSTREIEKLNGKADEAKKFITGHRYNDSVCFLIDMSIESGKNRFFIYDINKDSITDAGLVTHGNCNEWWLSGRSYSNKVGCGCTSLGKYKIGSAYKGKFGLAYKLNGLDTSNNNAYKRYVVLHSHSCVPAKETDPYPICQSNGCPTVAPDFLNKLAAIINSSQKPVLLWIFN